MTWLLSLLIGLIVVLLITVATGYFVAQEFAYMAVDRSRLAARSAGGDRAADRALGITRRTSFMLSGAQLGITVTGLLVGYVAEPLIGTAVGEALGGTPIPTGTGVLIGTVLALVVSTIIQMLFGELFPKNLAIARPEALALWLARSTSIYLAIFGWLIKIFDASSNALLKVLGIEPVHDVDHAVNRRDLKHIVAESRESGDLVDEDSLVLDRILDFPQQTVDHAVVPRSRVDVIDEGTPLREIRALMQTGHSRYPVLSDEDEVIGTIDLLDVIAADPDDADLASLMKDPVFVPESLPLPDAVRVLTDNHAQMACVVDEFGGFAGVITMEDLGEEIVGDIVDEHDAVVEEIVEIVPGRWSAPGVIPLDEVERALQRELPETSAQTLSGLVVEHAKGFPEVGDRFEIPLPIDPGDLAGAEPPVAEVLAAEVVEVDSHVPSRLTVTIEEAS
ncbi:MULTISPECIES: hemolysin family protein [Brevibacterium]|uniref:HlyC/CorC family transporter n=1 Tax=Brevibacterium casei TaxID=33889 RepID=A0A7T4A1P7_9MICO|nr:MULTISPECIES: hemolysin family protein [Brevibacterium]MCM1013731.1 hemolysin family protein [Brevibacterium sp. XM4083]QQB15684.1 HlyC/CorC family transporter [Brevibacterium casei]